MPENNPYKADIEFENLFNILSSKRFLNKEGLGGEMPFFIHSFPTAQQPKVDDQINSLIKRLQVTGVDILEVHLYRLCIDILKKANNFGTLLQMEKRTPKLKFGRMINGPLNIDSVVIPEIHKRLYGSGAKIIFLTGIGAAFPIIRSHTILNNLQTLVGDLPLVMFFPGTYNNLSLTLFDRLKDDNYYRAHNLNHYKF